MAAKFDPLMVEVIRNELSAITEEMSIAISRTGRSMQIKVGDCATALADARGRCIAEGAAPFQVASLTTALERAIARFGDDFQPGDVIMVNDPYSGMSHMPDCAIISPIFWRGRLVAFAPTYSHHTDMGGRFPGSFTSAGQTSYEEGLRIPFVKFIAGGVRNQALVDLISANVRNPEDWFGDIEAKLVGCRRGADQICRLLDKYGLNVYEATCEYLQDHAERMTRAALRLIPPGEYGIDDLVEEDGLGTPNVRIPLKMTLRAEGDRLTVDLTGTGVQAKGGINVPFGMTEGLISGVIRAVVGGDVVLNEGFMRPITIVNPEGTIFNPRFPGAVAGRAPLAAVLTEMTFLCFSKALPDQVGVRGTSGDMMQFSGHTADGRYDSFFDVFTGGWGGRPSRDGIDAVAPLAFRGSSLPVELLEREHPIVVEGFGIVPDSEGAGRYRGALSTYRQWRFLAPGHVMIRSDHVTSPSQGLAGGGPGVLGTSQFESGGRKTAMRAVSHQTVEVKPGDRIRHEIAGAGGYGDPFERDPQRVLDDVEEGKVSIERARDRYGVVIDPLTNTVDSAATMLARGAANVALEGEAGR